MPGQSPPTTSLTNQTCKTMTLILRKNMLRTCCLAALLGTLPAVMHAAGTPDYDTLQQNDTRRISGRVTDDTGKPLMGVTVVEKGTTNGVSTTADGSYTLRLQNAENAVLEFSFTGTRNFRQERKQRSMCNSPSQSRRWTT